MSAYSAAFAFSLAHAGSRAGFFGSTPSGSSGCNGSRFGFFDDPEREHRSCKILKRAGAVGFELCNRIDTFAETLQFVSCLPRKMHPIFR